ncbi:hypothetical protein CE11_01062 [Megavirus courdo11]|uniref:Uncharacterized protein n=2 Tax=Megavirus TaxID=3044761 RepID=K7YXC0_9VIRU|nr:hypothetical protein c7_R1180 [Megavirus courdo7]AFX93088.1 hypothetical protein CE11_01062 [Megavirus courdo11]
MWNKYVPVYDIFYCDKNDSLTVPENEPVYSMYTGNIIGFGPIDINTMTDVGPEHPKYGIAFFVIAHDPINYTWVAHSNLPDLVD